MKISEDRWKEAQTFEEMGWKTFDNIADNEWQEAVTKYSGYFAELETRLGVNDSTTILDVGCNVTCVSKLIKKGTHFGIEPLADALNIQAKVTGITVLQGMGENIPFDDNHFDLVICRNVVDHSLDPEKILSEMYRVLKPNGHLVLAGYVYNPFIWLVRYIGEYLKVFKNVGHPYVYSEASFEKLTTKGFSVLERKVVYESTSPVDFGKIGIDAIQLPLIQRVVLFVNDKLLGNKWFVRELCLLTQKRK